MPSVNIKQASVLRGPRITEKAAISADKNNVYVFEVEKRATKRSIAASIKEAYKVTPLGVRIVNVKPKKVFVRGKQRGRKHTFVGAIKKAYVELKKGDKIELI